jgi:hypothetical protein
MNLTRSLFILLSLMLLQQANGQPAASDVIVDTTITGFHYAVNFSGTYVYTLHGPSDLNGSQPTAFSVTFSRTVPFEHAKQEVRQLLHMSDQNGYKISDLLEKDTLVNGHPVYYISYSETQENYQNFVFNAVVNGDGAILVFTCGDLEKGKFIDLFKKTFYQLKF